MPVGTVVEALKARPGQLVRQQSVAVGHIRCLKDHGHRIIVTGKQKIEIAFAPSPLENLIGSEEIILTKIGQIDSSGAYGKTDHNIRISQRTQRLKPS